MHYGLTGLLTKLLLGCYHTGLFLENQVIYLLNWNTKLRGQLRSEFNFQTEKEERLLQLNELEELKNEAYDNARIYKDKTTLQSYFANQDSNSSQEN